MSTKNKKRRKEAMLIRLSFISIVSLAIIITTFFACKGFVEANDGNHHPEQTCTYKSIELKTGDTLWSIAEEYMPDNGESVQDYIDTLKEINGLVNDEIYSESYLTVVCYDYNL